MSDFPYVRVIDPDDIDFDRYGRVKDRDEALLLVHFYTGNGEPRA